MSRTTRFIVIAALFFALPATGLPQSGEGEMATPVVIYEVVKKPFSDRIEALGTLKANESVDLSATVTDMVTEIHFEDGQRVEKGDLLVKLDDAEEQALLAEEEAYVAEAQQQVNRLEPLIAEGAASKTRMDERQRELASARARADAIRARIANRHIRAPFDGIVGLRNISEGTLVQPGMTLATLDQIATLKLDFTVPEIFLPEIAEGMRINATARAYPDTSFDGHIDSIDPRVNPRTRALTVRARIPNQDRKLRPGMLMRVDVREDAREVILVPEEALIPEGRKQFVLVVTEKEGKTTVEKREVELGARQPGVAVIESGLEAGERIVTHGTNRARPGAPIRIRAEQKGDEALPELLNGNGDNNTDAAQE